MRFWKLWELSEGEKIRVGERGLCESRWKFVDGWGRVFVRFGGEGEGLLAY